MHPHGEGRLGCDQTLLVAISNLGWVAIAYSNHDVPSYHHDFPWLA